MDWKKFRKTFAKKLKAPAMACVLISLLILGGLLWVRSMGWLQRFELIAYDNFVRMRMAHQVDSKDDVIQLVGMTEQDLKELGYPISDAKLLEILKKIQEQAPCVIALDLYRDLAEPRIREGTPNEAADRARYAEFGEALKAMGELLYVIERVGVVKAPEALRGTEQVTANNLLKDPSDGVYRRGSLIVTQENGKPMQSLSLTMALSYLLSKDVPVEYVPQPNGENPLLRVGGVTFPRLTPDAGGYVGLRALDYSYMIGYERPLNFRHRVVTAKSDPLGQGNTDTPYDYSFGDVLAGGDRFPKGVLKDKVVVLATVMQSIKDSNPTPIDDNLRGVQQHIILSRQIIDAAEKGIAPMTWWPEWAEVLWIAGCTLAGGALGLWLRSPWKLVPALALLFGGIFFGGWFAFQKGVWILIFWPSIGALLSAALVTSYVVALERADRKVVQSLFSKHVSKKVADEIFEQRDQFLDGGKMAPRACTGTVIFTDLVGFSTASEKLSAHQVMKWLNAYMEVMASIVDENTGTVNKYIGDAIMGTFGAPIVHDTDKGINADAAHAIRCGLRMRREVPVLNAQWRANEPDMPSVAMRIGIFTGPLVSGSFGSAERLEWTVIGDTVNRANRLEAAGKEIKDQLTEEEKLCSILIGPETFQRVGHLFETEPVPDMPLKGISERVTVYRVLSERAPQPKA